MACLNFIILKVNGKDVSNLEHKEAVEEFLKATEPILVEVTRRHDDAGLLDPIKRLSVNDNGEFSGGKSQSNDRWMNNNNRMVKSSESSPRRTVSDNNNTMKKFVSRGIQTERLIDFETVYGRLAGPVGQPEQPIQPGPEPGKTDEVAEQLNMINRCLAPDIDIEKVTLQRRFSTEQIGLTLSYSSGNGSVSGDGSDDTDPTAGIEVYIDSIAMNSVAARDGRLQQGDQILQVNGKDVVTKEDSECLFAEGNGDVTLLVSRCSYPVDDYILDNVDYYNTTNFDDDLDDLEEDLDDLDDDVLLYDFDQNTSYENCLIEQLMRQESVVKPTTPTKKSATLPPLPYISDRLDHRQIRDHIKSVNKEISRLDSRIDAAMHSKHGRNVRDSLNGATGGNSDTYQQPIDQKNHRSTRTAPKSIDTDTEHIYETIPEDSESESIYCAPYDRRAGKIVEHWLCTMPGDKIKAARPVTSSQSSCEEHENSSSAYNTGGSSNQLTFELKDTKEASQSTLVLYPPTTGTGSQFNCQKCQMKLPDTPKKPSGSMTMDRRNDKQSRLMEHGQTMYTNMANLEQTMRLQQHLFRAAIQNQRTPDQTQTMKGRQYGGFTAPSLSQYQFVSSQQVFNQTIEQPTSNDMEWKVKKRPDGTRYIVRRPVRIRREVGRSTIETTEDESVSEVKIGRYWTKAERKRHVLKSRQSRNERTDTDDRTLTNAQQQQIRRKLLRKLKVDARDEYLKMESNQMGEGNGTPTDVTTGGDTTPKINGLLSVTIV